MCFTPGFQDLRDVTSSICKMVFHQQVWMFEWLLACFRVSRPDLTCWVNFFYLYYSSHLFQKTKIHTNRFLQKLLEGWDMGKDRKKDINSWCRSGKRTFLLSQIEIWIFKNILSPISLGIIHGFWLNTSGILRGQISISVFNLRASVEICALI